MSEQMKAALVWLAGILGPNIADQATNWLNGHLGDANPVKMIALAAVGAFVAWLKSPREHVNPTLPADPPKTNQ